MTSASFLLVSEDATAYQIRRMKCRSKHILFYMILVYLGLNGQRQGIWKERGKDFSEEHSVMSLLDECLL